MYMYMCIYEYRDHLLLELDQLPLAHALKCVGLSTRRVHREPHAAEGALAEDVLNKKQGSAVGSA